MENLEESKKLEDALDFLIESEGNKFKAAKLFRNKYNVETEEAVKFIARAYNKINGNKVQTPKISQPISSLSVRENGVNLGERDLFICDCLKKNSNDKTRVIEQVCNKYKIPKREAKQAVDYVLKLKPELNLRGIKKTIIVSSNRKVKVGSAISRGIIGASLLGPVGIAAGATAKTKDITTFKIIYNDGKQEIVTVSNKGFLFNEYCKYL